MTFGEMKELVKRWAREPVDDALVGDAVNAALTSIHHSLLLVNLSALMRGPVQAVQFAADDERKNIIFIADPVAVPVVAAVDADDPATAPNQRTLRVTFTLVTESGAETLPSPYAEQFLDIGELLNIDPPAAVNGTIGYNVYVAEVGGQRRKQSDNPIPFTDPYVEPQNTFQYTVEQDTEPTENTTADDIMFIESLQVQRDDGAWTTWQGADLGSTLMQRLGKSLPSTDLTQSYAFDLINQRTLEIRPKAGRALNPRLWYAYRPTHLHTDSAKIPITQFHVEDFVRYSALSEIFLGLHEYDAAERWDSKANKELAEVLLAANLQNQQKTHTVTPYLRG